MLTLAASGVAATLPAASPAGAGGLENCKVYNGTDGIDLIWASTSHGYDCTIIRAGGGLDFIIGSEGVDYIFGEGGDDLIMGNGGDDVIWGGTGDDHMTGGEGSDQIFGQGGSDAIKADDDVTHDTVNGGIGQDCAAVTAADTEAGIESHTTLPLYLGSPIDGAFDLVKCV